VNALLQLVYELRSKGITVGTQELLNLAVALHHGAHGSSFTGFYYLCRSILVHKESAYDDFQAVFNHVFKGVAYGPELLLKDLKDWLENPTVRKDIEALRKQNQEKIPYNELIKMLEERLREQKERHEGGSHWIGTGGTSPFGTGGYHPSGISIKHNQSSSSGGARTSLRSIDARDYRAYRDDVVIDIRQTQMALRKLRQLMPDKRRHELDLNATVDATARNLGDLEIKTRPERINQIRVLLLMDVGGSMDPFAHTVSTLFSAASKSRFWKDLKSYYFHNCVYDEVYATDKLMKPISVNRLLATLSDDYKVIFVGDAMMASYELIGWGDDPFSLSANNDSDVKTGLYWLTRIRKKFKSAVWLNPDLYAIPKASAGRRYGTTADLIARVFPMLPLTVEGLNIAIKTLKTDSR
jgi:uncharacterized protein with von Willebrand factor type A (vWA) domain